ncbi:MAG: prepilin peptidase [Candidatus Eisenbacteria bacterium]|uniref:Prepilin peptidase n=1 Tax=Eiseniibacteriota bacterium TaxID=2212470 RepID=A0A538UE10_UNCEI|nr:MAG: prepilin peptidase [Candidatus Eisenbacteria bacterium]
MNVPLWVAGPVVVLLALATRADVRTRTIPNRLTFPAMLLGVAMHTALNGTAGLGASLAGLGLAGAVLMPGYLFRWMGAGDVKLMAAVGAWLAWPLALVAVLASLMMGGAISLVVAMRRRMLRRALLGAGLIAQSVISGSGMSAPVTTGVRFPFAVAVFAGSIISFWIRP